MKRRFDQSLVDHLPYIRRVVSKVAKNSGVIDDISQEACVRIIEKEKLWDNGAGQLFSWMNMVARNLTINQMSKKKEQLLGGKEDAFPHTEFREFSEEQVEWVIKQFSSLPQKQKKILDMKYNQDLTLTQIGKELGITRQSVSHHINMALKTLRHEAKTRGMLAYLFPWNWDKRIMEIIALNKMAEVAATVLVLGCAGFVGFKTMEFHFSSDADTNKQYTFSKTLSFADIDRNKGVPSSGYGSINSLSEKKSDTNTETSENTALEQLIELLKSDDLEVRNKAIQTLAEMGEKSLASVEKYMFEKATSLDVRLCLLNVLEKMIENKKAKKIYKHDPETGFRWPESR